MSTLTNKLELIKPDATDNISIQDFNTNFDIIDGAIDDLNNELTDYMVARSVELASKSCKASSSTSWTGVSIASGIPSGYKAVCAIPQTSGSAYIFFWNCVLGSNGTTVTVQLKNTRSSAVTVKPKITVLCIRNPSES